MARVTRFEDLRCWQSTRLLTYEVYKMSKEGQLAKDFDTRSQFRSAGLSVMNNIAEGFGRFSDKDFLRFLDYATGSCTEVKSMGYLLLDLGYFPKERIDDLHKQIEKTKASILAFMRYLRQKLKDKE